MVGINAYPRLIRKLSDEERLEIDSAGAALVEDVLLVEALMDWDGDRCACPDCTCQRLRDGADLTLCAACLAGDHWRANG